MKKHIALFLSIFLITLCILPASIYAANDYTITVEKTSSGFDSGDFTFEIYVEELDETTEEWGWVYFGTITIPYTGGTEAFNITTSGNEATGQEVIYIVETGTNGATGVLWSMTPNPNAQNGIIDNTTDPILIEDGVYEPTVYFDNIKVIVQAPDPEPTVRTHDMTCWQVWINEDNNFEFIFWWVYENNNWVQIYDMSGNLVWETDFAKGQSHFVADLPDGKYIVKTFHEYGHILQEFEIGKP